ncbi:MAG: methionine--tRNA ligase [Dehalococcoidia bacterium]|nr:methionine--tRNA ligase [Dehalococcoidia bacterium]
MPDHHYITTSIYYVNDEPHIGHAHTTVLADVLARYRRLQGRHVFFLTGTDEHGQKVRDAAVENDTNPKTQADRMVVRFQDAWNNLNISHDDFIRTTERRHTRLVESILRSLWDKGDIYFGEYVGWYCVPDERFWTEKDLVDAKCPDCGRAVEKISEGNYFFRMSGYQKWLVDHLNDHAEFIQPTYRRNEVLGYLGRPLGDLCITRPVHRLDWGVRLPFDPNYVTYVWFDALINYLTAAGFRSDDRAFERLWPTATHLIGKDILITHSVFWLTMLKAIGIPPPKTIFAHGWWNVEGAKMSKSVGNVAKPLDLASVFGTDAFRYFLVREMAAGRDAEFSEELLRRRYESTLANDLGNLAHRLVHMITRYCDGAIPEGGTVGDQETELRDRYTQLVTKVFENIESFAFDEALRDVEEVVRELNRYVEWNAPWARFKHGDQEAVRRVLYHASEALRLVSVLISPVMPEKTRQLWESLGWTPSGDLSEELMWGRLRPGSEVIPGHPLFPKN